MVLTSSDSFSWHEFVTSLPGAGHLPEIALWLLLVAAYFEERQKHDATGLSEHIRLAFDCKDTANRVSSIIAIKVALMLKIG